MPSEFLLGVPGKLKTLLDRLTATRAGYLDNLDAAVTTRAPSSTALSTATWTAGRAAAIDNLDIAASFVPRGSLVASPDFLPRAVSGSAWYVYGVSSLYNANTDSFFSVMAYNGAQAVVTGADTWVTIANITSGQGMLLNAIAPHGNSASNTGSLRITVDGTEYTYSAQNGSAYSALLLGPMMQGTFVQTNSVLEIPYPGGYKDQSKSQVGGGIQCLQNESSLTTPEIALSWGMPLLWFSTSLKVEAKASIYSTLNAGQRCAASYVLR